MAMLGTAAAMATAMLGTATAVLGAATAMLDAATALAGSAHFQFLRTKCIFCRNLLAQK